MSALVRLHILCLHPQRRSALLRFVQRESHAHGAAERLAVGVGQHPAEIHQRVGTTGFVCCALEAGTAHTTNTARLTIDVTTELTSRVFITLSTRKDRLRWWGFSKNPHSNGLDCAATFNYPAPRTKHDKPGHSRGLFQKTVMKNGLCCSTKVSWSQTSLFGCCRPHAIPPSSEERL